MHRFTRIASSNRKRSPGWLSLHPFPMIALAATLSSLAVAPANAGSTTGAETVSGLGPNQDMNTSNWRQDNNCTSTRTWDAAADSFSFSWNSAGQDQIGRIGRRFDSQGYAAVMVDDVVSPCVMSTTANMKSLNTGTWFMWMIYGWTAPQNSFGSRHNEYYVVFQGTYSPNGYESLGSVTIDGVQFDCYRIMNMGWDPGRNQYMAICRSGNWGGAAKAAPWNGNFSIDLKKMFDFWRSKGLENEYVVEETWGIEGYSGSSGTIQMSNLVIPYLDKAATPVLRPVMPSVRPALETPASLFTLSGKLTRTSPKNLWVSRSIPLPRIGN